MIYDVIVAPAAENGIAEGFAYIRARSPENAERWLRGLYQLVHKLESMPKRCVRLRIWAWICAKLSSNRIESSFRSMRRRASYAWSVYSMARAWD